MSKPIILASRVTKEESQQIANACKIARQSLSQFLAKSALDRAKDIMGGKNGCGSC